MNKVVENRRGDIFDDGQSLHSSTHLHVGFEDRMQGTNSSGGAVGDQNTPMGAGGGFRGSRRSNFKVSGGA